MVTSTSDEIFRPIPVHVDFRPPPKQHIRPRYNNLVTINPIEVRCVARSADYETRPNLICRNAVNYDNLVCVDTYITDVKPKCSSFVINARSIRSNSASITDQIEHSSPSIIAITETWNKDEDSDFLLRNIALEGYQWWYLNRVGSRGGGLAIIYQSNIKCTVRKRIINIELLSSLMKIDNKTVHYTVVYRPPSGSLVSFFEIFTQFLEDIDQNSADVIIVGDFNLHIDNPIRPEVSKFIHLLDDFGLKLRVQGPTHVSGHTLDLVITRQDSLIVQNTRICDLISDHMSIFFDIDVNLCVSEPAKKGLRPINKLDIDTFIDDLRKSDLVQNPMDDLDDLVDQFNGTLRTLLDKHAPQTERSVKPRKSPWYTTEIHKNRQLRRKLTRKWRKTQSNTDKARMIAQRDTVQNMINSAKSAFYKRALQDAGTDSKTTFRILQELLCDFKSNPLPDVPPIANANGFNTFFVEKINRLKDRFNDDSDHTTHDGNRIDEKLESFSPIDINYVNKLIQAAPNKTCDLDPVPTSLLKSISGTISPVIMKIINTYLSTGAMPSAYKTAIVKPLLKKQGLDPVNKNIDLFLNLHSYPN